MLVANVVLAENCFNHEYASTSRYKLSVFTSYMQSVIPRPGNNYIASIKLIECGVINTWVGCLSHIHTTTVTKVCLIK